MKTLILYATKHGAAREIAAGIGRQIDGAVVHDLKVGGMPALSDFDCIIIGSSLYAGSIRKEEKTFLSQNAAQLQGKKVGLFLSGISKGETEKSFADNFPSALLQAATAKRFLGGIFDPKKAGAAERLIMKAVTKGAGYVNTIEDEDIRQFAELMKA